MDPKFSLLLYSTNKMPTAEDFQIRLWTDRYRGSELIWQPSIIGMENEGLGEILENGLNYFGRPLTERSPPNQVDNRAKLLSYVLVYGGNSLVPRFDERVAHELRMLSPSDAKINVVRALDAKIDAWRGGALLANQQKLEDYTISKAEWEECGHHYLKEHSCSNFLYGQKPQSYQKTEFKCQKAHKRVKI